MSLCLYSHGVTRASARKNMLHNIGQQRPDTCSWETMEDWWEWLSNVGEPEPVRLSNGRLVWEVKTIKCLGKDYKFVVYCWEDLDELVQLVFVANKQEGK